MTILTRFDAGAYRATWGKHTASDTLSAARAAEKCAKLALKSKAVRVRETHKNAWNAVKAG